MGILDAPLPRFALSLGAVVVIAGISLFASIREPLRVGAQSTAGMLGIVVLGWVFTGLKK